MQSYEDTEARSCRSITVYIMNVRYTALSLSHSNIKVKLTAENTREGFDVIFIIFTFFKAFAWLRDPDSSSSGGDVKYVISGPLSPLRTCSFYEKM